MLKVAQLARIELKKSEEKKFANQLSAVLDNFQLLNTVNTKGIKPTAQVTELDNVYRNDEIKNPSGEKHRDELFSNTADVEDGLIKVPGVFNHE